MGIERYVITALSLLSELFEELLACDLEDFDEIDREVLIDQVDDAGRHITSALFALRPDLAKLAPERRVRHLDALFARYPYELDCRCTTEEQHIRGLATNAHNELLETLATRNPRVRDEADFAMSHLDVVLLLLDPDMYSRAIESASSDDRVKLAAQAEQAELMLEEARELVKHSGYTSYTP